MNFNNIAIISVKGSDYRVSFFLFFWCISKDDSINTMENFNLNETCRLLLNFFFYQNIRKNEHLLSKNKERLLEK